VPSYILNQIENVIIHPPEVKDNLYVYGRRFTKPSKILAEVVIQALRKLKIEYEIKSTPRPIQTRTTA
jgi:hypothetical protein